MTYAVKTTSQFKRSYKLAIKRGLDISQLEDIVQKLKDDIPLAEKFHDHQLTGKMKLFRECHIQPDWLLIYLKQESILTLTLVDTGSHADLFGK